jgi:hypothetical protein
MILGNATKERKMCADTCREKNASRFCALVLISIIAGSLLFSVSCSYRVRSSIGTLPSEAASIGIPTFRNLTTQYKIEQLISRAVLKEFATRTRQTVNSSASGVDLVLLGEIRNVSAGPVAFGTRAEDSQTTGSTFLVTVHLGVKLMRLRDSAIIWENEDFLFRERHIINGDARNFFSEENPALERLARNFAASLTSAVLTRSKP